MPPAAVVGQLLALLTIHHRNYNKMLASDAVVVFAIVTEAGVVVAAADDSCKVLSGQCRSVDCTIGYLQLARRPLAKRTKHLDQAGGGRTNVENLAAAADVDVDGGGDGDAVVADVVVAAVVAVVVAPVLLAALTENAD